MRFPSGAADASGGRIIIIEFLLKDLGEQTGDPSMIALIHLHMRTLAGGREQCSQNSTSCSAVQDFGASPCGLWKAGSA